jgi:hypothetical protein
MPQAFDKCKERPAHIEQILNGLDRYNPETTTTFQEYVNQQCEEKFFDVYAGERCTVSRPARSYQWLPWQAWHDT